MSSLKLRLLKQRSSSVTNNGADFSRLKLFLSNFRVRQNIKKIVGINHFKSIIKAKD
jgi:hypothetical protein